MRALLLFAAISSCIFSQDQSAQDQAPLAGKFYGPLATPRRAKPPVKPPAFPFKDLAPLGFKFVAPKAAVSKCAVPLLEMNVPPASVLPMATITPPPNAAAPGGEAKSLLPPC